MAINFTGFAATLRVSVQRVLTPPWRRYPTVYVVLQDEMPDNPLAGVFRTQEAANLLADAICEKYPTCTVEFWPVELEIWPVQLDEDLFLSPAGAQQYKLVD